MPSLKKHEHVACWERNMITTNSKLLTIFFKEQWTKKLGNKLIREQRNKKKWSPRHTHTDTFCNSEFNQPFLNENYETTRHVTTFHLRKLVIKTPTHIHIYFLHFFLKPLSHPPLGKKIQNEFNVRKCIERRSEHTSAKKELALKLRNPLEYSKGVSDRPG